MPKVIFSLLVALGYLMIPLRSKEISKYNDCKWFSEVEPEAYFQVKKYIPGTSWNLTRADLIYKGTARNFNPMMAAAGRTTIVEVEHLVENGQLNPNEIHTPSIYVDRIFEGKNYEKRIEKLTIQ